MCRPASILAIGATAVLLASARVPDKSSTQRTTPAVDALQQNVPARPRALVDVPALKTTGRTVHVPAGGDLQKALDEAKAGDRIELEPRATYEGPFRLKQK